MTLVAWLFVAQCLLLALSGLKPDDPPARHIAVGPFQVAVETVAGQIDPWHTLGIVFLGLSPLALMVVSGRVATVAIDRRRVSC